MDTRRPERQSSLSAGDPRTLSSIVSGLDPQQTGWTCTDSTELTCHDVFESSLLTMATRVKEIISKLDNIKQDMKEVPEPSDEEKQWQSTLHDLQKHQTSLEHRILQVAKNEKHVHLKEQKMVALRTEMEQVEQLCVVTQWNLSLERRKVLMEKKRRLLTEKVGLLECLVFAEDVMLQADDGQNQPRGKSCLRQKLTRNQPLGMSNLRRRRHVSS